MAHSVAGRHLVSAMAGLLFLAPVLLMVAGSLRPAGEPPPLGVELVPANPTLDNYRRIPELIPLLGYLANSALVVAIAVPLTVLVASWAGFGIRLLAARRRTVAVVATVALLLVPVTAVWGSRFEVFRLLGVTDTYLPLVAPALAATTPFYVLIYAWSFGRVRDSQLEAARLEGASPWRVWAALAMPQARPASLAVTVLAFTWHWGNLIDPLLYVDDPGRYTAPLGLAFLQVLGPTDWPLLMAGSVLLTLPAVAVLLLAQRVLLSDDPLARLRGAR
ncbi:MAG: carbohydrate ABC transporter permease [Actinomycetota bacterium]|nr:carbohydrate ABC transporter permease [Actinomycetota bacterium]